MGLSNFDILKFVKHLKIPNFKGPFMRDELPRTPEKQECGIVNFKGIGGGLGSSLRFPLF